LTATDTFIKNVVKSFEDAIRNTEAGKIIYGAIDKAKKGKELVDKGVNSVKEFFGIGKSDNLDNPPNPIEIQNTSEQVVGK